MNLETKIIWRQVLIGPKFDPKNFFPPQDHNYLLAGLQKVGTTGTGGTGQQPRPATNRLTSKIIFCSDERKSLKQKPKNIIRAGTMVQRHPNT